VTVPKKRPTPEEMDERIVAPKGTKFEDVVAALLNASPVKDEDGTPPMAHKPPPEANGVKVAAS